MRKTKYITLPTSVKYDIQTEVGCSRQAVYDALYFRSDGDTAQRIRRLALSRGGKETFKLV